MDRRKLFKGIISAALLPFIPKFIKQTPDVAWENKPFQNFAMMMPGDTYEHDTHGEYFYMGEGEYRRGEYLVINLQTNKLEQLFFHDDGTITVLSDDYKI